MPRLRQHPVEMPLLKRLAAALLLLGFLGLLVVSVSHALHQELHHDAGAAHHECVLVQISSGHCLGVAQPAVLPEPPVTVAGTAALPVFIFVSRSCPLLPGRAPPSLPA